MIPTLKNANLILAILFAFIFPALACDFANEISSNTHEIPNQPQPRPEDILSQVDFVRSFTYIPCPHFYRDDFNSLKRPFVAIDSSDFEDPFNASVFIGDGYDICIAGFAPGEVVPARITAPDGETIKTFEFKIFDDGLNSFQRIWYPMEMEEGEYQLEVQGKDGWNFQVLDVKRPTSPNVTVMPFKVGMGEEVQILYSGFKPHQKLKVFVGNLVETLYKPAYYSSRWVIEMDENGEATDTLRIAHLDRIEGMWGIFFDPEGGIFGDPENPGLSMHRLSVKEAFYVVIGEYSEGDEFITLDNVKENYFIVEKK